jgi:uncharacterized membrane protein
MTTHPKNAIVCEVCQKPKKPGELFPLEMVRDNVFDLIRADHPDIQRTGSICAEDLDAYRTRYIQKTLEDEKGELSTLEKEVLKSIHRQDTVSKNINTEFDRRISLGDRLSDRLATVGGSWAFIGGFGLVLLSWIVINTTLIFFKKPFDPFPFILLNLALSCLAAIQAPVILMSQNRQDAKDRLRSEYDYRVNLKAELEIRHLHQKLDHFLHREWQTLIEIQEIQMDLMKEISAPRPKPGK